MNSMPTISAVTKNRVTSSNPSNAMSKNTKEITRMTRRAYWQRGVTQSNGELMRYTMPMIWEIGKEVTVAGTRYRIEESGWRKLG